VDLHASLVIELCSLWIMMFLSNLEGELVDFTFTFERGISV
jgi:hypothetical protein